MNLKLTNIDSELVLSKNFQMTVSPFIRRTGIKDRYGKDGGRSMGDGRANSRTISFAYNNKQSKTGTRAEKDISYRNSLNAITGFFDPVKGPWYLVDLDNEIRCEVVMSENSDEPITTGMEYITGKNDLKLIMLDGHWEDAEETVFTNEGNLLSNGDTFTIVNDSLFYCWPIFKFTSTNTNSEFSLTNSATDESFNIGNAAFTVGKVFTIDGVKGMVDLSGVESSISMFDGSGFISLAPGENQFLYESPVAGSANIEIRYRRRYAH